mgnify:CR=1 FL=1
MISQSIFLVLFALIFDNIPYSDARNLRGETNVISAPNDPPTNFPDFITLENGLILGGGIVFLALICRCVIIRRRALKAVVIRAGTALRNLVSRTKHRRQPFVRRRHRRNGVFIPGLPSDIQMEVQSGGMDLSELELAIQNESNINISPRQLPEDNACAICYTAMKSVVFEPCNHNCACKKCSWMILRTQTKCPLCRQEVVSFKIEQPN